MAAPGRERSPARGDQAGEVADFGRRMLAGTIDAMVVAGIWIVLVVVLFGAAVAVDVAEGAAHAAPVLGQLGLNAVAAAAAVVFVMFALLIAAAILAAVLQSVLMRRPGRTNGQSLGKRAIGIRVVRTGGRPFRFLPALARELGAKLAMPLVPGLAIAYPLYQAEGEPGLYLVAVPFLVDRLWALARADRRTLHDLLASTRVVRAETPAQPAPQA